MLIRYYGHVGVPTGFGEAAAEMCMAILTTGYGLEISTNGKRLERRYLPLATCIRNEHELTPPDVIIVHTLPLDCNWALENLRSQHPNALMIAYTTWEACSHAGPIMRGLAGFDQVWVPSSVTRGTFSGETVHVVPHAFDEDLWDLTQGHSPASDIYRFLYVGAWTARKNVDGLVRAYLRAFHADDPVELMIQSAGAADSAAHIAKMSAGLGDVRTPPIRFCNQRVSRAEVLALHRDCQAFVSATRGEAWNMPAFDAMLARRHIVVTEGTGSDDFLLDTSATRIRANRVPAFGEVTIVDTTNAPPGHGIASYFGTQGLSCRDDWLDPDLDLMGRLMRRCFTNRHDQLDVHYDPRERYGRVAVGKLIEKLLSRSDT